MAYQYCRGSHSTVNSRLIWIMLALKPVLGMPILLSLLMS
jgi:hypothetical protein